MLNLPAASPGIFRVSLALLAALLSGCISGPALEGFGDPDYLDARSWPKEIDASVGKIVVYSPQLETFRGDAITAQVAVSVERESTPAPLYGAAWLKARLFTDRERWIATFEDVQVTNVRFPQATPQEAEALRQSISSELPRWRLGMTLDHLREELALVERERISSKEFRNDPPEIIVRSHPAVQVTIDGDPDWKDVPETPYRRLANSDFFMLRESSGSAHYLHIAPFWWTAPNALGPWKPLDAAPEAALALLKKEPPSDLPPPDQESEPEDPPEPVVATKPTELLWTDGPADLAPVAGTNLLYARNTRSDLFLEVGSQTYFVLLSGRWYKGAGGEAAWTYVPADQLPADFSRIPAGGPKGHVLASVAGTSQANDALRDAQIPQTAALSRGVVKDLWVPYDGPPLFARIKGSPVEYAENTPYAVFRVRGRYYLCHLGAWYESGGPQGPWALSVAVAPEIYLIPPSCPNYYCTYCFVYDSTPDTVYVGYEPGYLGSYCLGPTVVFGTGWHYPGWRGLFWFSRPVTFGVSVTFDLDSGCWEFDLGFWGPCAWAGRGSGHGHRGHAGIAGWWGGVARYRAPTDGRHNVSFQEYRNTSTLHDLYARQPGLRATAPSAAPARFPLPPKSTRRENNVFADRLGDIFRKTTVGGWEKHTASGWARAVSTPSSQGLPQILRPERELVLRDRSRSLGQARVHEAAPHSSPRSSFSPPSAPHSSPPSSSKK